MNLTKDDVEKIKETIDCHIDELENEHSYATNSIQEMKQFRTEIFSKLDKIFPDQEIVERLKKYIKKVEDDNDNDRGVCYTPSLFGVKEVLEGKKVVIR